MGQRCLVGSTLLVLSLVATAPSHAQSWVKPITIGGAVGAVGGGAVTWALCDRADNNRVSCAAFGGLVLAGPGMATGAILRATRTSGWDGAWVGAVSGVAMGLVVGGVAAIVGSGDQPADYLLLGRERLEPWVWRAAPWSG